LLRESFSIARLSERNTALDKQPLAIPRQAFLSALIRKDPCSFFRRRFQFVRSAVIANECCPSRYDVIMNLDEGNLLRFGRADFYRAANARRPLVCVGRAWLNSLLSWFRFI